MHKRRTLWMACLVEVLLVALLLVLHLWPGQGSEGYDLVLRNEGDSVTALIDGQSLLTLVVPPDLIGDCCGLYVYHPYGGVAHRQYFRNLLVRGRVASGGAIHRYHLLDADWDWPRLNPAPQWKIDRGRGAWHSGVEGDRAVLLLPRPAGHDAELSVHLAHPSDAGLVVRATDADNGLAFVIRPDLNDAFFFRLEHGRPGAVLDVVPLQPLAVGTEARLLVGDVARLALRGGCLVLLLWLVVQLAGARPGPRLRRLRLHRFVRWGVLVGVPMVATAWVGVVGLQRVPHLADETAYWFQAGIYAHGHLWATVPELPEFFKHDHILMLGNRWLSKYPPLFPLLLATGMRAGVPWLVNPLLAGLLALAVYRLAAGWAGRRAAWASWALLVSSPFFLLMGGNLMSHMAAALFAVLALLAGRSALREDRLGRAALCGAAIGAAMLTRPFTALLLGGVFALTATGVLLRKRQPARLLRLGSASLAGILPFIIVGALWLSLFKHDGGEHTSLNVYSLYDQSDRLGFGADRGYGWLKTWGTWGHTPAKALRSVRFYLRHTSHYFLGWPWQLSLMLVPVPLLLARHRGRYLFLMALMLALIAGHMCYWATQHIGYGARYWFAAVPLAAVLSGVGLDRLTLGCGRRSRESLSVGSVLTLLVVSGMVVWNLSAYLPKRLHEARQYGNVTAGLHEAVRQQSLDRAIVFVETEGLLFNDGFFMNDPFLRRGPFFVRDLGARNGEFLAAHPGYVAYRWDKEELRPLTVEAGGEP
ncbi:MAG: glycosyltransferase family 39 protein [Lentisphaerae bacterium]|nr:glycosyltransferase family 39 protein [Lentisphaerota bacterium]